MPDVDDERDGTEGTGSSATTNVTNRGSYLSKLDVVGSRLRSVSWQPQTPDTTTNGEYIPLSSYERRRDSAEALATVLEDDDSSVDPNDDFEAHYLDASEKKTDGEPFSVDPSLPPETQVLTWRAVLVGSFLGLIVGASNIYLGLKTGFSFGASLFGAIFGFAIIKPLSRILSEKWGGGYFGPKENCTVQSAATAAGGLTTLFVAAVPAMYHLGLMKTPSEDINKLFLLTAISAFYGLFFAVPLRKYYILQQKLVFPTPTATAYTIQSLHATTSPSARRTANKKINIIASSFVFSLTFKTIASYVPGMLWDWHIFWWLYRWGMEGAVSLESWGWWIADSKEFTPAFYAAGALSGLNASWSFMIGTILAWGVIGPLTVATGVAVGQPVDSDKMPGMMNYMSMTSKDPIHSPSPRYWMLWPGVMVMLVYSFVEVLWSSPAFYRSFAGAATRIQETFELTSTFRRLPMDNNTSLVGETEPIDPAPPHEQIKTWQWTSGLLISSLSTLIVGKWFFDVDFGVGIVALFLAFIFSFIGVQSSGTTDVNPVGTIAKASQLVVGGITRSQGLDIKKAQKTNLLAGAIASQAASHSVDMVGDLKTGHLLSASPASQFWAQVGGSFIGIWLSVILFVLFASAYPCITDLSIECSAFGMPAVTAWRSVTEAVTKPELPIPPSSAVTAAILGILAGITVPVKNLYVPPQYRAWVPNWSAIGLGFVVPQTYYPLAMVIGAHIASSWETINPASWEVWGYSLSAGLIAGEGIGGVVIALLVILGLDGSILGSSLGCPGHEYCG
ncbi:hypothetical protein FRB99_000781 [Tulasnella sp. 403]|nr:hypothetical protein FRB99_000781 [Tulasnella sp. 403]